MNNIRPLLLPVTAMCTSMMILGLVYYKCRFSRWLLIFLGCLLGAILGAWLVIEIGIERLPWILSILIVAGNIWLPFQVFWMYSALLLKKRWF